MITLEGVTKTYDDKVLAPVTAVDNVSLAIADGEFVVISGRSGSGKTTLLNLMAGLARPSAGAVRLDGTDLWGIPDKERCRLRHGAIGFVFQFPSLMPTLTALENVVLPSVFGAERRALDLDERALELLRLVGIAEKAAAFPRQLSAGQQQRVVLARALINRPRIIMADEPTSNLDERTEAEMMALFSSVHGSTDVTIVMVTHALALLSHGTRAIEMASGHLVAEEHAASPVRASE
ncbi:MAG: ABC transporter ATP-binding protein [Coriobacteriia bacterium]|nr:ABC transporter ATP-binding protein [Coriobacteriia bacterium]